MGEKEIEKQVDAAFEEVKGVVKSKVDEEISLAANELRAGLENNFDNNALTRATSSTIGKFANVDGLSNFDKVASEWGDAVIDEIKGDVKKQVDKGIQRIADKVQQDFISKIGNDTLRDATSATLGKLASVDGLIGAFKSVQGASGLIHQTFGEMGRDIEKFIGGEMTRADLMDSMAQRAESCISATFSKMATTAAAEFGPLAPVIGEVAGYIAGKMFREAVAPFINAARKAQMAREKYERLHALYEESNAQMRLQRQQFERETAELFEHRQQLIDDCFEVLDGSISVETISEEKANKISAALDRLARNVSGGNGLQFQTKDEFITHVKAKKPLRLGIKRR